MRCTSDGLSLGPAGHGGRDSGGVALFRPVGQRDSGFVRWAEMDIVKRLCAAGNRMI